MQNSKGRTRSWLAYWYSFIHFMCLHHKICPFKKKRKRSFSLPFLGVITAACRAISISQTQAGCQDAASGSPCLSFAGVCAMHKQLSLMCVCVRGWVPACVPHRSKTPSLICHPRYLWQLFYRPRLVPALPILCISANRLRKIGH